MILILNQNLFYFKIFIFYQNFHTNKNKFLYFN